MHHFFVSPHQIQGSEVRIEGQDVNHIRQVLRMKQGEELSVSNGVDGKEYRCEIEALGEEEVLCRVRFVQEDGVELPSRISLFQCLPKGDKMEMIIQKAVELGVYEIIPVAARRSVVKLDPKKQKSKLQRWQGIAEAAAKQSRRGIVPRIREVMSVQEAAAYGGTMDVRLMPYELSEGMGRTRACISSIQPGQSVAVWIGPEGGFAPEEAELAAAQGFQTLTLGRRILRTETAGLTVLAWLMYQLEEETS